ncbi:GntR family transcriptional regulator [Allopusillimonas ginsengisoli]|uniref:GntR family transcriptional regulator n=1 Tax=Allopusillimonas ginsengisoli TaxID=453575 RepID=UPI001021A813|nr:GntR family transcriptional regulator [Allopusillimonas ginsengisoli]TEA78799.1 GntR family transcriptional regulator [Allopusillimonas ginsengisoli]
MHSTLPTLAEAAPQMTVASLLYHRLRSDILLGTLGPGSKLTLASLAGIYGAGMIPLREALNRLSAEGLVTQHDQRGFFVCEISQEDVIDLTQTRCWLYEGALRKSIENGGREWENEVVLSFYRLGEVPRYKDPESTVVNQDWADPHRRFHTALIAACGSRRTIAISENLFDQAERYRNLARLKSRKPEVHEEHRQIMDAALRRDADTAVRTLLDHLMATCSVVVRALAEKEGVAGRNKPTRKRRLSKK